MPELPEVETIKRVVEKQIAGSVIESIEVGNAKVVAYPQIEEFTKLLCGQRIVNMDRRGKYIIFNLENGDKMYLHLRMTGQLLVTPTDYPQEKHTHLIFNLGNNTQLRYIDVRRFGRFWYIKKEESTAIVGVDKLGVEAIDQSLTGIYLKSRLGKRKKAIKEMLLDQSIVAGIGNIYADEILYISKIHPQTKCTELSDCEWDVLAREIPKEILWAIEANEITPEDYLAGKGKEYRNTPYLQIYGKEGKECPSCGSLYERIVIGGRSSCYCPKCQKKR